MNSTSTITDYIKGQVSSTFSKQSFIITGAPSAGKTTIINELGTKGYTVIHEAAAQIIAAEKERGVVNPWDNPDFEARIIALQKASLMKATADKTCQVVVDRSPIDAMSYCLRMGHELTDQMIATVQECVSGGLYSKFVFWVEHLGEVENNGIRHENLQECEIIEKRLKQDYEALGFVILSIPKATVEERTRQVMDFILKQRAIHK
jgi:predicted ATPase